MKLRLSPCLAVFALAAISLAARPPAASTASAATPLRHGAVIRAGLSPTLQFSQIAIHKFFSYPSESALNLSGMRSFSFLAPNPFDAPILASPRLSPVISLPLATPPASQWLRRAMAGASPPQLDLGQLHAPATTNESGHGIPTRWLAATGVALAIVGTVVMATGWH